MADFNIEQLPSILAGKIQVPAIVVWNRFEGRPRKDNFQRALGAEVRDPYWFLCRQWQVGEYKADDAGSPVEAKIKAKTTQVTKLSSRDGNHVFPFDSNQPLETRIENQQISYSLPIRQQIGRYWIKLLHKQAIPGITATISEFKEKFPFQVPERNEENAAIFAHKEVLQVTMGVAGRALDGGKLMDFLLEGNNPADVTSLTNPAEKEIVNKLGKQLVSWFNDLYFQKEDDETFWNPEQLEYQFAASAPEGSGEKVLIADQYYRGHLDWYSLDIDPNRRSLPDIGSTEDVQGSLLRITIPGPIDFNGMPNPRWWQFEEGRTNFSGIDAHTTELGKLAFLEFGLVYSNDWFLIPFDLPVGTIATIEGMAVTDVFGDRYWIEPAGDGIDNNWQRWGMYNQNKRGELLAQARVDTSIFLAPALGKSMESKPVEHINLIRDEMANMVWGIERVIQLSNGYPKPGDEAATEFRNYLKSLLDETALPEPLETDALIRYELMNTVPENWIPLIPVKATDNPLERQVKLQRAAMLRILSERETNPKPVQPRTSLLRHGIKGDTTTPYYISEIEVPRSGTQLFKTYQRARGKDGKVYVWLGWKKRTGHGEGNSGLQFDQIRDLVKKGEGGSLG